MIVLPILKDLSDEAISVIIDSISRFCFEKYYSDTNFDSKIREFFVCSLARILDECTLNEDHLKKTVLAVSFVSHEKSDVENFSK